MATPAYKGSITTTGSSEAIRFDKGLFKQNPEFRQKASVEAHVIGRGMLLVRVVDAEPEENDKEDPMMAAFLAFLEKDITEHPERLIPVTESLIARGVELTKDVVADEDEDFSDFTF